MPGGCNLGDRPIDIHLKGLKKLGVRVDVSQVVKCDANKLVGNTIVLTFPSVGATLNLITASIFDESTISSLVVFISLYVFLVFN